MDVEQAAMRAADALLLRCCAGHWAGDRCSAAHFEARSEIPTPAMTCIPCSSLNRKEPFFIRDLVCASGSLPCTAGTAASWDLWFAPCLAVAFLGQGHTVAYYRVRARRTAACGQAPFILTVAAVRPKQQSLHYSTNCRAAECMKYISFAGERPASVRTEQSARVCLALGRLPYHLYLDVHTISPRSGRTLLAT